MPGWWGRFIRMPDGKRARALAWLAAFAVVALLYGLGGVSVYLRSRYLAPRATATTSESTAEAVSPEATGTVAAGLSPTFTGVSLPNTRLPATSTLYPTITPAITSATRADDGT